MAGHALKPKQTERGQAAVEFVLAFLFVLAVVSVLFQALHFELDVFNKSLLARYELLKEARQNQDDTDGHLISKEVEGKRLGDLLGFNVPFQDTDLDAKYGPKQLWTRHGTKYWDPAGSVGHSQAVFFGLLAVDHYEDSAGYVGDLFGMLQPAIDALQSF
jgi:hypothetical protein